MNLVQITPGAGGMYCGNCIRDNALVAALRQMGHDTVMIPLYLPMTLDESDASLGTPTFYGGVNVFLSHWVPGYRRAPEWLRRWFDHPRLLKWASGRAAKTRAQDVGSLNVSMLRGEEGRQVRELENLLVWMRQLPKPDAVFLSNALLVGMARRIRQDLQTKVIVFLQSEESYLDSMVEPWRTESWELLAQRAKDVDAWISPSRYFAERMTDRLRLSPDRVHVVPNGVSLAGYDGLVRPTNSDPVLGYFARMCPEKGMDIVVDAFIELHRRGTLPRLRLHLGGGCGPSDEPFVRQEQTRLQQAGLDDRVALFPNLSRDEKLRFYAGCDVLSVPSRQSEAFGLYVIESLAAGTPLIQPSVATFPELIQDTGGGVLCGPNEPIALADCLEEWLQKLDSLRAFGLAGQQAVRDRYTDQTMAQRIAAIAADTLLPETAK